MDAELTKSFAFSASYSAGARALGRNYIFSVTVPALTEAQEPAFEETVQREILSKVHTRDLGEVDFLRGIALNDEVLLRAFWKRLAKPLEPYRPKRLSLQRDARTVTVLHL